MTKKGAVKMDIHQKTQTQSGIRDLHIQKNICEQTAEQAFETDYLLPDYLPDIFKILKCDVLPSVTEVTVSEGKILTELSVEIRILYLVEQTRKVAVITQKQSLQKQTELPDIGVQATACVSVRSDSLRCRVVNPRRIDVKGALLLKISAEMPQTIRFYVGSQEKGKILQENTADFECITGKQAASEEVTVSEETMLPYGNPAAETVLLYRCTPSVEECRRSGDKVMCKGNLNFRLLYLPKGDEAQKEMFHTAEFSVPVDSVMDLSASPDAKIFADIRLISAEMEVDEEKGEQINGQYQVNVSVTAIESETVQYVNDLYSTACPVEKQTENYTVLQLKELLKRNKTCKNVLAMTDGALSRVFDVICDVKGSTLRQTEDNGCVLALNLTLCLLALDENMMPFCTEKTVPCELALDVGEEEGEPYFVPEVSVTGCNYRITEVGELEVRTDLQISGCFCRKKDVTMVVGVTADEKNSYPKDDAALHLYYAKTGEDVWEIAKAFKTDYGMTMSENDLTHPMLNEDRMILIPVM